VKNLFIVAGPNSAGKTTASLPLLFLWLESAELAIERVRRRVQSGGHNIPEETIIRRYKKGLENFFQLYLPCLDTWMFYDNSKNTPQIMAEKLIDKPVQVFRSQFGELSNAIR
jgi:predicted ABC-type ATPase